MLDLIGQIIIGFFKYGAIINVSFLGLFLVNHLFKLRVKIIDDIMVWITKNFIMAILKGIMYAFLVCAPVGFLAFIPSLQEVIIEYVCIPLSLIAFFYGIYDTWKND